MPAAVPFPRRFRRRLAIAFVLVAAGAGGLVVGVSSALIEGYRERTFVDRARATAAVNTAVAPDVLTVEGLPPLLRTYREQGRFETVALLGDAVVSSDERFDLDIVPAELRPTGGSSGGEARTEIGGEPYLVVAGDRPETGAELYFFFSRRALLESQADDRRVLLLAWLGVTVVAALVGTLVARRTLTPVTRAADAARRLSEGLLNTRLRADRRDEFGVWAESFNEMAAALQARIADLAAARDRERRFTADVAHDLRTPVSALVAEAELLTAHLDDLPPAARRPAELLAGDVERLADLVEGLLELARLDAGRAALELERADLATLAERAAVAASQGADEDVDLDLEPVDVEVDHARVERIVRNLVGNAVHHGATGVRVAVRREGAWASVEVSDRGPGIDPVHLPHVFERFYRADRSRAGGGTGLGLSIAREDARVLGGELDVRSQLGQGTTFRLRLPARAAATEGRSCPGRDGRD